MIKYNYEGKEYLLEFDRASVEFLEKTGFTLQEFSSKMATMQPLLFRGAFLKNHRFEKGIDYEKMWDATRDKQGLTNELINMVAETYQTLLGDNNNEGNASWEVI